MDKEVLEVILKKCARESSINRIIDMKVESALPKGENYTSSIFRAKLKVVQGSGRVTTKSYILKKENVENGTDETFDDLKLTDTEISMYLKVLQQMEYLIEEFGDTEGPLWCKLIHLSQADSTFILEDLKASGFSTVKRTELQDIEHARLVLRSLGRFHAMAKVIEERGHISKDDYKPLPYLYDKEFCRTIVFGGVMALVKGMRATWGEEWAETADLLGKITFEEFVRRMKNCVNFGEDIFRCLNHGDLWNNNMMFKHNWEGNPTEIRFIDFQLPHYNSPCLDVIYYIYTSIKPHLRRQNYKSLIKFYHDSLTSSLDRFGFQGSKPSLNEIEVNMERLSFCILAYFPSCYAVDSSKTDDAMDMRKILETKGEEGLNISVFSQAGIKENIAEDVKTLVKKIQEKM
ncbi:uncharacterized protein [Halyomorpha halys]|uniref:uncharacterized protein n=1 Tax=Halyomorpha halys TaxID=286706 RepID=UPI0006D4DDE2|nr:uncharacterized protein LOC106686167 [Halyomorpha halys]XP_014284820.1 uncharacterized protein LOC106686167 [Halyomorpha halys]XP_014284821.1 uncharacterized protein LOC106686167 [Halyomorpha halys]